MRSWRLGRERPVSTKAEVLRGELGVQRQLHLREPPLGAPEADELTDGLRLPLGLDGHRPTVAPDQIGSITSDVTGERPFAHRR